MRTHAVVIFIAFVLVRSSMAGFTDPNAKDLGEISNKLQTFSSLVLLRHCLRTHLLTHVRT